MPTTKKPAKKKIKNTSSLASAAFMGQNPFDLGAGSTQLDQLDTLFKNNRWNLISNLRQLESELYVEHGLIKTLVDVPVDDGMRGGVKILSKQLSEDQIKELQIWLDREDILSRVHGRAGKWQRLYGGAGVIVITDQDPMTPLDVAAIGSDSPLDFRAVDMWELFWDKQNDEGFNIEIQEEKFEFYSYYATKLHKSRVMKLKGLEAPSFVRPRLRGWGLSILESVVRSMNQYLKANQLGFEVLDEFKVDVYKMKNLVSTLLSPDGLNQIQRRVHMNNQQKNFNNALVMDSEDDFIQKELSFTGIAEVMQGIRLQIASDLRMPLSKLFGIGAQGFSSGEDDIENYNGMVEAEVRAKCKYHILTTIELMCQKKFGFVPDDLEIEFKPLRMLTAEQEENVKTQKFNRLLQAKGAGEISSFEFKEACNKDNLLSIQLDTSVEAITTDDAEESEDGANKSDSASAPKSTLTPKEAKT